jgi:hypothetical protein
VKVSSRIPSGAVHSPQSTLPPQAHGILAGIFANLAAHHQAMASGADRADPRLPRPDVAAKDVAGGRPIQRQPVLGVPDSPYA